MIYNGTKVERMDRGRFSALRVLRSGDWLVGQEIPGPTLRAYRISDGAFAAMSAGGLSALAILGPKK